MKSAKRTHVVLLAAVAGLSLAAAGPVFGQARVDTGGHAMDANNQVGSGGFNAPTQGLPVWTMYQNAVVTNNVTGGVGFAGKTFNGVNLGAGYTDPFAFRGLLAGQGVDQFIAESTGVPTMANPMGASNTLAAPPQPFFGTANHSSAPPNFQLSSSTPGYIPSTPQYQTPEDTRLGVIDYSQAPILPRPDEVLLPGQVDPTAQANPTPSTVFAASPLYGVRQWQFGASQMQPNTDQTLGQPSSVFGNQSPLQQGAGLPVTNQTPDQARLMALRQQLSQQSYQGGSLSAQTSLSARPLPPLRSGSVANTNPNAPLQSPVTVGPSQLTSVNLSPQAGDFSTQQSTRQYLNDVSLPAPTQQSTQYAQLEQMMQTYDTSHPKTDEEANREFQQILKLRQRAAVNAELGSNVLGSPKPEILPGAPGSVPGAENPQAGAPPLMPAESSGSAPGANAPKPGFKTMPNLSNLPQETGLPPVSPQPVEVNSFAAGVKAKGLADLIANGESLVEQEKYDRAIATYNDAIQVAPNNPLILTARANAEIGGGYYAQAYTDLHNAIGQDPAVLIGQYDLQKHFGPKRLKAVSDDLKEIVEGSPKDATHAFLYAYVLYNSHHVGSAAEWLDAADKRSGGQDPAILQMKKYWNFDSESPAAPSTQPSPSVPSAKP